MAIENEILRYQLSRAKEKIIEKTICTICYDNNKDYVL